MATITVTTTNTALATGFRHHTAPDRSDTDQAVVTVPTPVPDRFRPDRDQPAEGDPASDRR